jgi:hypothetical protein
MACLFAELNIFIDEDDEDDEAEDDEDDEAEDPRFVSS